MPDLALVRILANSFLAGEPSVEQVVARSTPTLGRPWRWLRPLAQRYVKKFAGDTRPRQRDVVRFLQQDAGLRKARRRYFHELSIVQWITAPPRMLPVAAAASWPIPAIESSGDLATWLRISPSELRWFADLKGLEHKTNTPRLRHYYYKVLSKQFGNIRLLEAPKSRLKQLQRKILSEILEKIPSHPSVHGFVRRRSIKTFTEAHVGRNVVLRMDLRDFFPSFRAARIQAFFRTAGYPEPVATLLAGICTNVAPRDIWKEVGYEVSSTNLHDSQKLYSKPHLPQGAPTSPALANLCSYRIDCRLSGLARSVNAEYTRYADDLAFSGDETFEKRIERFSTHVAAILVEEGFTVHFRKTRVMRQGVRQHLAGLVVNQHQNVMRADFDRLKATLTNCVRSGAKSQNRDDLPDFRSHLEGRVGFVEMVNPARGYHLRKIFEQIEWGT